jgi:predicted Zn-dependent peptidase
VVTELDVLEAEVGHLHVVASRAPWAHSTVGILEVDTGYSTDPPGKDGVAHLTEHVCVASLSRKHGVRIFAKTDSVSTRYLIRAGEDGEANVADVVDAMFSPEAHDTQVHENETNAVLIEIARLTDQPQLSISPAVAAAGFSGLDVTLPDIATDESVRALTPADVLAFRQALYRPARAVLSLVGPRDPAELLDVLATRAATTMSSGTVARKELGLPFRTWPARHLGSSCALALGTVTALARSSAELAARHIAEELLAGAGGLLDRLGAEHRTRSSAFSILTGREQNLLVTGWPVGEAVAELIETLRRAIDDPATVRPTAENIAVARSRVISTVAFEQRSAEGLAQQLLKHVTRTGPWPEIATFESVPDETIATAVGGLLGSARLWRIVDGALVEVVA